MKLENEIDIHAVYDELLVHILALVPFTKNGGELHLVCQKWSEILNSNQYYIHLLDQYFPDWQNHFTTQDDCQNLKLLFKANCAMLNWNSLLNDNKHIYIRLYMALSENNFDKFMTIFDNEYSPSIKKEKISASDNLLLLLLTTDLHCRHGVFLDVARKFGYQDLINKFYSAIQKSLPDDVDNENKAILPTIFNQTNAVVDLVKQGCWMHDPNRQQDSLIVLAAEYGNLETIRGLLALETEAGLGQRAIWKNKNYEKSLRTAAVKNYTQVAIELAEVFEVRIDLAIEIAIHALKNENKALADYFLAKIPHDTHQNSLYKILRMAIQHNQEYSTILDKFTLPNTSIFNSASISLLDFVNEDLVAIIGSVELDSILSDFNSRETDLLLLTTPLSETIDLVAWDEEVAIDVLQTTLVATNGCEKSALPRDLFQLLMLGGNPSLIINLFHLPDDVKAVFLTYYVFMEITYRNEQGQDVSEHLALCHEITPKSMENITTRQLAGTFFNGYGKRTPEVETDRANLNYST